MLNENVDVNAHGNFVVGGFDGGQTRISNAPSDANLELMLKMRTYMAMRNIDIMRLFKDNNAKNTSDGCGTISTTKFMSTLLDAFHVMKMPPHGLESRRGKSTRSFFE